MKYKELQVTGDLIGEVATAGKTLSQRLEEMDPSADYTGDLGKLDAFDRQLLRYGVFPYDDPKAGIRSTSVDVFFQTPDPGLRLLFPEFIARVIREAKMEESMLNYLIAGTKTIEGNAYRSTYIDDNLGAQRKRRVPIGTPLPKVTLAYREQTNVLHKFGVAIEIPYEVIRRMTISEMALFIKREARQSALDEAEEAIDVLINGDGNVNTSATTKAITDVNADASAGTLDYKSWLIWAGGFRPYNLTTVVGGITEIADFLTMDFPNIDPYKVLSTLREERATKISVRIAPQIYSDILLVLTKHPDLDGEDKLLCFDKNFAIQRLVEASSTISENSKFIERQTNILTISENSGFSSIFPDCVKILNYKKTDTYFLAEHLRRINDMLKRHVGSEAPHQFVDHRDNKVYIYGLCVSIEGKPQIIYEEAENGCLL